MDGKILGFLQTQAEKVVADSFAAGRGASELAALIDAQWAFYQAMEDALIEAAPPERTVQCGPGCVACCYQKVAVTIPEAIGLAQWLSGQDEAEQARVLKASLVLHNETAELHDFDRIEGGRPCPILKKGRCSAYDVRPVSCRMTYSFSRSACERFYFKHRFKTEIPHYDAMVEMHTQLLMGFSNGLEAIGLDGGLVELASALSLLLADPGLTAAYLDGARVFETAKLGRFRAVKTLAAS